MDTTDVSVLAQRIQELEKENAILTEAMNSDIHLSFKSYDRFFPNQDTLLTMPIAWEGNVEQYAGRLHREYAGKREVCIYDYVDIHLPLCDSMYRKRLKGYSKAGYGKIVASSAPDRNLSHVQFYNM